MHSLTAAQGVASGVAVAAAGVAAAATTTGVAAASSLLLSVSPRTAELLPFVSC